MKLKKRGKNFSRRQSKVEILNFSKFGIWVLVDGKEYFVDFDAYPWLKDASVEDLADVHAGYGTGLYWPALDLDISIEALEHPERFPLAANFSTKKKSAKPKAA